MALVGTKFMKSKGYDGSIAKNPQSRELEYCVFDSDDIHILGSKKDVENFNKYLSK